MRTKMRIALAALVLLAVYGVSVGAAQSSSPAASAGQDSGKAAAKPEAKPISVVLQPGLSSVQQAVEGLRLEKWKGGTVRNEATDNIGSILHDLHENLPTLLQAADASPGTVSRLLPLSRNVDALYDVLLRVVDGARIAAPADQVTQLQQAQASLENGRHGLNGRIQEAAEAQEKQVSDLQIALKAQAAPVCPAVPAAAAPVCPATTPAHKAVKKKAKPPVSAPAQPAPATPAPKQ